LISDSIDYLDNRKQRIALKRSILFFVSQTKSKVKTHTYIHTKRKVK